MDVCSPRPGDVGTIQNDQQSPGLLGRQLNLQGVLFKRGAYNFPAVAHDERMLVEIERAASTALVQLVEENEA